MFFGHTLNFEIPANYSFLGREVMDWLIHKEPVWLLQLIDIFLVFGKGVFLNFILTSSGLFPRRTFVPALIFITLTSFFGEWIEFSVESLARPFILLSLYNLFALSRNELSRDNIFYTALYTSIACLFYFPSVVFLLVVLVGLFIRSYSVRDFILVIVGFIFPFYFIGIYYYYKSHLLDYLYNLEKIFITSGFALNLGFAQLVGILFILFLSGYGYLKLRGDEDYKIIKVRRLSRLLTLYMALTLLVTPFIMIEKLNYLQLFIVPASVYTARVFDRDNLKFYHQLLFISLLAALVVFQLSYFGIINLGSFKF